MNEALAPSVEQCGLRISGSVTFLEERLILIKIINLSGNLGYIIGNFIASGSQRMIVLLISGILIPLDLGNLIADSNGVLSTGVILPAAGDELYLVTLLNRDLQSSSTFGSIKGTYPELFVAVSAVTGELVALGGALYVVLVVTVEVHAPGNTLAAPNVVLNVCKSGHSHCGSRKNACCHTGNDSSHLHSENILS